MFLQDPDQFPIHTQGSCIQASSRSSAVLIRIHSVFRQRFIIPEAAYLQSKLYLVGKQLISDLSDPFRVIIRPHFNNGPVHKLPDPVRRIRSLFSMNMTIRHVPRLNLPE